MKGDRVITSVYVKAINTSYNVMNCANPIQVLNTGSCSVVCERIERTQKNGEMAHIPWLEIHTGMGGVVEVREADCIIAAVDKAVTRG